MKKGKSLLSSIERSMWGNEAVWMATLALSRGVAVPVAVHEGKDGRNTVLSRPLQAPEKAISTAE